jgi:hypothetical protein
MAFLRIRAISAWPAGRRGKKEQAACGLKKGPRVAKKSQPRMAPIDTNKKGAAIKYIS